MLSENKIKSLMENQGYRFVGNHSAVKICRWTKKSIRNEGVCYKEKFYGIDSHKCCQITPWLGCENHCIHCWRAIEFDFNKLIEKGKINSPSEIIKGCIEAQRKLLEGFKIKEDTRYKTVSKADMKKWQEAQEPMQFAISLSGEPTVYPKIGELIKELTKRGKTSFLVTNGLYPEVLKKLEKDNQLPTQLYISVNAPNKKLWEKISQCSLKNGWERFNQSLVLVKDLRGKTRTIFRMNLVKELNMSIEMIGDYIKLIKKANPLFIEVKGFMSVGFARQRLGYKRMPDEKEMKKFCDELVKKLGDDFVILDSHERSRAFVIGHEKDRGRLKIK